MNDRMLLQSRHHTIWYAAIDSDTNIDVAGEIDSHRLLYSNFTLSTAVTAIKKLFQLVGISSEFVSGFVAAYHSM